MESVPRSLYLIAVWGNFHAPLERPLYPSPVVMTKLPDYPECWNALGISISVFAPHNSRVALTGESPYVHKP